MVVSLAAFVILISGFTLTDPIPPIVNVLPYEVPICPGKQRESKLEYRAGEWLERGLNSLSGRL